MKNFFQFLRKHRFWITVVLLLIVAFLIAIPFIFFKNNILYDADASQLEIAEHIAQILAAMFVVAGSFIAVFQYYISSSSEIFKMNNERISKAIDLADFYKEKILKPYSVVRKAYKDAGIFDQLKKEKNKMKDFDEAELHEIFTDSELKNLEKMYTSPKFLASVVIMNDTYGLGISCCEKLLEKDESGNIRDKTVVNRTKALEDFHLKYVAELLNNIELFAMYFSHGVADESVVYQSLYPTYIEMCQALYYDIAKCSIRGGPKLYRNVQFLYKTWYDKMSENLRKANDSSTDMGRVSETLTQKS